VKRSAKLSRKTKETEISVEIGLDEGSPVSIDSGIPFLDHMLELFARHGAFSLSIKAKGDLHIDCHHTIEDLGLVLGNALGEALGEKRGIARYGWALLPMDEALAMVSIDISGRPHLSYSVESPASQVAGIDPRLFHEFFQALVSNSRMTLHIKLLAGAEAHHAFEAIFKSFAKALRQAVSISAQNPNEIPSTKGIL